MQSEQQLLQEISRLKNAISRQTQPQPVPNQSRGRGYPKAYTTSTAAREVTINGSTFRSSARSLVRQPGRLLDESQSRSLLVSLTQPNRTPTSDCTASGPPLTSTSTTSSPPYAPLAPGTTMIRTKKSTLVAASRLHTHHRPSHSPATSHPHGLHPIMRGGKRGQSRGRGLGRGAPYRRTRPTHHNKTTHKPKQPIDKPCREFTRKGICLNGLMCRFKHNPDQVAICPKFFNDECPLPEGSCPLSHDPTPERVPVCIHFANGARCRNGPSCKYPHVRLGPKEGVCRDFAVLGFCGNGTECPHQHVRECPDFAATGTCPTKGCRLPHVIRAQHKKKSIPVQTDNNPMDLDGFSAPIQTEDYISLTFNESSEEESEGGDNDVSDEEGDSVVSVDDLSQIDA